MAGSFSVFDAARLMLAAVFLFSICALGIALLGEHVFGIRPCILCLYQRVPYVISAVLAGRCRRTPNIVRRSPARSRALRRHFHCGSGPGVLQRWPSKNTGGPACLAATAVRP